MFGRIEGMDEQDLRVAKQILPRLVKASVLLDAADIQVDDKAKCVGAIADAPVPAPRQQ